MILLIIQTTTTTPIAFNTALASMASYLGNGILPVLAGLSLVIGVYNLAHKASSGERYLTIALACLMCSGLVRLVESFATAGGTTNSTEFYTALLTMTNWLANVMLPIYAAVNVIRGVLSNASGGAFEFTSMSGNTSRHFMMAGACVCVSGGLRLLEFFVTAGTAGVGK